LEIAEREVQLEEAARLKYGAMPKAQEELKQQKLSGSSFRQINK